MLAGTVLLLALAAQAPAGTPATPSTPAMATDTPGAADPHLTAGIAAFRHHRFAAARAEFEKAEAAEPQSAAAAFYLGYTYYKIGEPSRRMNANKEKAKELFAKAFSLDPAFKPTWGR
jgi:Tfp pilus assembly protein PilF